MGVVQELTNIDLRKAADSLTSFFKNHGVSLSPDQERLAVRALDGVFNDLDSTPIPTEYSLL